MGSCNITIKVKDFTLLPGARTKKDGDGSAEEFFEKYIQAKATKNDLITIDFDGTWGYASSFMSQLAKYLVSFFGSCKKARNHIEVISKDEPGLRQRFFDYMMELCNEEEAED